MLSFNKRVFLITWGELLLFISAKFRSFNCDEMYRQVCRERGELVSAEYLPSGEHGKGAFERKSSCLRCQALSFPHDFSLSQT